MTTTIENLRQAYGPEGNAREALVLGQKLEADGALEAAATAYDRAYGLAPHDSEIGRERGRLLDRLAVSEHGLYFRYVPTGTFLMGSDTGDPDEQPIHAVELEAFWVTDVPISWATYCELMDWMPAPESRPRDYDSAKYMDYFILFQANKIRRQYCEGQTVHAVDWHAHDPEQIWTSAGNEITAKELFGEVPRLHPKQPWRYDTKPMVSISWQEVEELGKRLTSEQITYRLPSEAEWEKAARGGLIGQPYSWGDSTPTQAHCDFDHFRRFSIGRPRDFPANGYGLYGMSGGVWEWTADWYDAEYYQQAPHNNPTGPMSGEQKVLRGGSWADCAEAVTVSYRMARAAEHWRERGKGWHGNLSPNIGFRLCRSTRTG